MMTTATGHATRTRSVVMKSPGWDSAIATPGPPALRKLSLACGRKRPFRKGNPSRGDERPGSTAQAARRNLLGRSQQA